MRDTEGRCSGAVELIHGLEVSELKVELAGVLADATQHQEAVACESVHFSHTACLWRMMGEMLLSLHCIAAEFALKRLFQVVLCTPAMLAPTAGQPGAGSAPGCLGAAVMLHPR